MVKGYDPARHHRRSIRLKDWDYRTPAAYFVTICTYQRQHLFDEARFRQIAESTWRLIPKQPHAAHARLDEWIVMPNHLHGIIVLSEMEEGSAQDSPVSGATPGSLPSIVANFKSLVTRRINKVRRSPGRKVWQRGYYERIVRNDRELNAIRRYIRANPGRWAEDRENLDSLVSRMQETGS